MRAIQRSAFILTVTSSMVAVLFIYLSQTPMWKERRWLKEREGFLELQRRSCSILRSDGNGNRIPEGAHFQTFDLFFERMKQMRAEDVATSDAKNPYPGILRLKNYGRLTGAATRPDEPLIWSSEAFTINGEQRTWILTCDGHLKQNEAAHGTRPD